MRTGPQAGEQDGSPAERYEMSQRGKILLYLAGIAMVCLLLVVVFGDNGWMELHRMRTIQARLLQENEALQKENQRLYRNIDRMQHDPEFIENAARRELGMIRGDEWIFKFKTPAKADP